MLKNNVIIRASSIVFFIPLILWFKTSAAAQLDCMVKPEMYVELSSPVPGVLDKVLVNKGDHISKGQAVAQLEASVETAKVKQLTFEAANTSEITSRKAQLEFALRYHTRAQNLFAKGSLSKGEMDKAETDVTIAEAELAHAVEQKKSATLMLEVAQAQLQLKTIKSPINGIVIDRYAMVGESVENRAIMKLAQVNPLRVELVAPTEYFGLIEPGMAVEIRPEHPANKSLQATVTVVDQLIDPASGSFAVRLSLPNPDDKLIGGVNCIAIFGFDTPALPATDLPDNSNSKQKPLPAADNAIDRQ